MYNKGYVSSQTTSFKDNEAQNVIIVNNPIDMTHNVGVTTDSNLGSFLSRPVLIDTQTWTVGSSINTEFNPWTLFFSDTRVADRIRNYKNLRCKLHVKMVLNGNPFYQGRVLVGYQPLHTKDAVFPISGIYLPAKKMAISQMPSLVLDPCTEKGGEFELPFLYNKNFMDVTNSEWSVMGLLRLVSFGLLRHGNGGVDPITINTFAWATDVELCVPTVASFQSEYATGIISKPATAIAGAAASLSSIPRIKKYAKATEQVFSSVAKYSHMFGFSRPVNLEDPHLMRPTYAGQLSVTDTKENVAKLSLDSKQELTVDPSVVGLEPIDHMAFSSVVTKESYLTTFDWTVSDPPSGFLFNSENTPTLCNIDSINQIWAPTPMGHVSALFRYWTGSIVYRFTVIANSYHRGRLRISIDPTTSDVTSPPFNANYSRIVDISKEKEFEMCVDWMQPRPYLSNPRDQTTRVGFSDVLQLGASDVANGTLRVEVLNELTGSSAVVDPVSIVVFVRGGNNLTFFSPSVYSLDELSFFQSSVEEETAVRDNCDMEECDFRAGSDNYFEQDALVFGGERCLSFRSLLRRYWYHTAQADDGTGSGIMNRTRFIYPDFPNYRGPDPNGINQTSLSNPWNYSKTTLLNYITPAYVTRRGALRYKYLCGSTGALQSAASVSRLDTLLTPQVSTSTVLSSVTPNDFALSLLDRIPSSGEGTYLSHMERQPVLEVELPFYSPYRFAHSRFLDVNVGDSDDSTDSMFHRVDLLHGSSDNNAAYMLQYVSVGEDFSLGMYLHAPAFFKTPSAA